MTVVDTPAPVMELLKTGTRPSHDAVEATSFSERIVAGDLPRDRYAQQLLAYRRIHDALERGLRGSNHSAVSAVWQESMAKLHLLEEDVAFYEANETAHLRNPSESPVRSSGGTPPGLTHRPITSFQTCSSATRTPPIPAMSASAPCPTEWSS